MQAESCTIKHLEYLIPPSFKKKISEWLEEDIPSFDYSAAVVGNSFEHAYLYNKSPGVLAGVPFDNMVMELVNCEIEWHIEEGTLLKPNVLTGKDGYIKVATIKGNANNILMGERLALNILATASGIAWKSYRMNQIARSVQEFQGKVAATRKVTPGIRLIQKYAVVVGGCDPHRMDLSSMIMLKDNAIESCGSIPEAIEKARRLGGFTIKIEVESRNREEAIQAAKSGADMVMLDNFTPFDAITVSKEIKELYPGVLIEVSGGITEESCAQYMGPHIDILSSSSIIQGAPTVDYSLKISKSTV